MGVVGDKKILLKDVSCIFFHFFNGKSAFSNNFYKKVLTILRKHVTMIMCRIKCEVERRMLIFILIPFLIAYFKGYRIRSAFQVWDLYPFFAACACHAFFVINAWLGNHSYVRFASLLQFFMIFTLLLPIVWRRITYPTLVGVGMSLVGTLMNHIAIRANGGKMPVYPTVSKWIGYYREGQLDGTIDDLHVLMDESSRLVFLTDYFDFGSCVLSPGDLLIHSFASIIIYYAIKASCPKAGKGAVRDEALT